MSARTKASKSAARPRSVTRNLALRPKGAKTVKGGMASGIVPCYKPGLIIPCIKTLKVEPTLVGHREGCRGTRFATALSRSRRNVIASEGSQMARTTQKSRTQKTRRQVTRDLTPTSAASRKAKGGAVSSPTGAILVGMGDGSVRMGDGSVRTIKPSI